MEQFYRLNPTKLTRYQPYLNEQIKRRGINEDTIAWRHGGYVQAAVGALLSKRSRYPSQPRMLDNYAIDDDGEVYEMTDADRFWAFATAMNQTREIKAIDAKIAAERAEAEKAKNADGDVQ